MFQCAGALWDLSSKVLEVAIISYPFIAQFFTPSGPILAFPLAIEVPSQWNGFTPQDPKGDEVKMRHLCIHMNPVFETLQKRRPTKTKYWTNNVINFCQNNEIYTVTALT
jgi:hypothetical protein